MSADKNVIKDLKIKTNSCLRMCKDLEYSAKEIARQNERIQAVKDDPEKDSHDVKKQEEVLAEMHAGVPVEVDKLDEFLEKLRATLDEHKDSEDIKVPAPMTTTTPTPPPMPTPPPTPAHGGHRAAHCRLLPLARTRTRGLTRSCQATEEHKKAEETQEMAAKVLAQHRGM